MADPTYQPKTYHEQPGDRDVIASGGSLDVESGGEIDVESGGALKLAGTQITATAPEINEACDKSVRGELLTATKAMDVEDNGKTFWLNNATTEFTTTLPAIADAGIGFRCRFIVKAAPSGADYVITEKASADTDKIITNGINELAVTTATDGPSNTGHTTVAFDDGVAIAGDWVEFECDGTNWYCTGQTNATSAIDLA
jgi:hypothetical protein